MALLGIDDVGRWKGETQVTWGSLNTGPNMSHTPEHCMLLPTFK